MTSTDRRSVVPLTRERLLVEEGQAELRERLIDRLVAMPTAGGIVRADGSADIVADHVIDWLMPVIVGGA